MLPLELGVGSDNILELTFHLFIHVLRESQLLTQRVDLLLIKTLLGEDVG